MRIGIDTYSFDALGDNYGVGPGIYVWSLLPELFRLGAHHEFVVFTNKETQHLVPRLPHISLVACPGPNRFRPYRILHEQVYLPMQFMRQKLDILHFLGNNISFILARRSILTVHDLMWEYYARLGDRALKYKYFKLTVPRSLNSAKAVITVSDFVGKQVRERYRRIPKEITAIPEATGFLAEPTEQDVKRLDDKYGVPFIMSVTTLMPHKNLHILLRALSILREDKKFEGKLVVVGQLKGEYLNSTRESLLALGLEDCVTFTGFIPETEKTYCYKKALAFVYPSLYEGFGLPVLEAMSCGTPVIASNAGAIPEVGGDACLYFDPNSVDALCASLVSVLREPRVRRELINRGLLQEKKFTWASTAQQTLAVYERSRRLGRLRHD